MLSMLMVACLQAAAPPPAQGPANTPPVITRPIWIRRPSAEDFARHYPERAVREDLSGTATIECVVSSEGGLAACAAIAQEPEDALFGKTALRMSSYFKMEKIDAEGRSTVGGRVRIPLRFLLPLSLRLSPVRVTSAQFAGAQVELDCRFTGRRLDNCLVIDASPWTPELRQAALMLAKDIGLPKSPMPSGRVRLPLQFESE